MAKSLLLGLAAAAIPILSASAAPATPEEAARLTALFERYVGHPAAGQPGSVTVVPQGESYVATLDLQRAAKPFEGLGLTLDPAVSVTTLTPNPDGTWRVTSADSLPIVAHFRDQSISVKAATGSFDGVYDPKLYAFGAARQEQTGVDTVQTGPTLVQSRHTEKSTTVLSGVAAEGGTASVKGRTDITGTTADLLFKSIEPTPDAALPGTNPVVPPPPRAATSYNYTVPSGTVEVALDRFHTKDILDLWAFLVAHPDHDSLVAAQGELKALLKTGLPYADALKESAAATGTTAMTPVGPVSFKALGGSLDLTGLAGTGKGAASLSFEELKVPAGVLPPWSSGLVPTGLALNFGVEGFHARDAALAVVDAVDLSKSVVITPEQKNAASHLFWPGAGTLTLNPSRITTAVLDLKMEGQAVLGPVMAGTVTVTGTGLDKEIAALQAQAATDPGASQVLGPLVLAKNLAKPNPDGSLGWVIAFGNGPVTVNGAPLQ